MQFPKNIFFVAHIQKKDQLTSELVFFQRNKSLTGFVKCTSCVKYASRVKCAAAREGIYFISLYGCKEQYFTIHEVNYFTFCREAKYFTKDQKLGVLFQVRKKLFHIRRTSNISLEKISDL